MLCAMLKMQEAIEAHLYTVYDVHQCIISTRPWQASQTKANKIKSLSVLSVKVIVLVECTHYFSLTITVGFSISGIF